jgi:hypothetical protein
VIEIHNQYAFPVNTEACLQYVSCFTRQYPKSFVLDRRVLSCCSVRCHVGDALDVSTDQFSYAIQQLHFVVYSYETKNYLKMQL